VLQEKLLSSSNSSKMDRNGSNYTKN